MSRQQVGAHAAFAQSQDENWTVIDDAQERKRVQNRLAQRSYRKVRERLQELDQLKTAEQGEGQWGGTSIQASTRRRHSAFQVKTASTTASNAPLLAPSTMASESMGLSESIRFTPNFGGPSPSSSGSAETGKDGNNNNNNNIEDLFADFCSSDGSEADTMGKGSGSMPQKWTAPLSQSADYGFDLFGPLDPSGTPTQKPELRFTELMVRIRDVGFVDMESLILEYYSTQFRRDSLPYWLQRRSRQQNLCKLLEQLYTQSWTWPVEECVSFQCGIKRIAERVLTTENPSNDSFGSFSFSSNN